FGDLEFRPSWLPRPDAIGFNLEFAPEIGSCRDASVPPYLGAAALRFLEPSGVLFMRDVLAAFRAREVGLHRQARDAFLSRSAELSTHALELPQQDRFVQRPRFGIVRTRATEQTLHFHPIDGAPIRIAGC